MVQVTGKPFWSLRVVPQILSHLRRSPQSQEAHQSADVPPHSDLRLPRGYRKIGATPEPYLRCAFADPEVIRPQSFTRS